MSDMIEMAAYRALCLASEIEQELDDYEISTQFNPQMRIPRIKELAKQAAELRVITHLINAYVTRHFTATTIESKATP